MAETMRAALAVEKEATIQSVPIPDCGEGEVLVKVVSSGINRLDTLQRKGIMPVPAGASSVLGLECAGEIAKLGSGVEGWSVGDRVMALVTGGGNAEYIAINSDLLMRPPANLSWVEAGAMPETWLTAFQLLYMVGGFAAGMTLLIHAAGSGVGLAAIQIARAGGAAKIVVTAGSQDKIDAAVGVGADAGVIRHDNGGNWVPGVMEATDGHGADLILDCVGGTYWEMNAEVAAVDGTWVLFGTLGGPNVEGPFLRALLKKRLQLRTTTLRARPLSYKANLVKRFSEEVLPGFSGDSPTYKLVIDRSFALDQIAEAHAYMESNSNTGKVALIVDQEAAETKTCS